MDTRHITSNKVERLDQPHVETETTSGSTVTVLKPREVNGGNMGRECVPEEDKDVTDQRDVEEEASSGEFESDNEDDVESTSSEGSTSSDGDEPLPSASTSNRTPISDADSSTRKAQTDPEDIKSRLASFLPVMAEANANLSSAQRIDNVADGEDYVEMNLGLGVLEEKRRNGDVEIRHKESSGESSDDESEDGAEDDSEVQPPEAKRRKIGIEEVE